MNGGSHIPTATATALYCHFYLAEVETLQLGSNIDNLNNFGTDLHTPLSIKS